MSKASRKQPTRSWSNSAEPTHSVRVPVPMPHQSRILLDDARFKLVFCGRRWGKTSAGLIAALVGHGPPNRHFRGAIDGGNIWWATTTMGNGRRIWRTLKEASRYAMVNKNEVEHRIEYPGGGSITVISMDKSDNNRGDGLDGLVLDEAAFMSEDAWKYVLRPSLADKGGWVMFLTTPNGQNWAYDEFQRCKTNANRHGWQRPSSDNPLISRDELGELKIDMGPMAFAQEHEAQFVSIAGSEFSSAYFGDNIWFDEWPHPDTIRFRVMALDPSKGKTDRSDFSSFTMIAVDDSGTMFCDADMDRRDVRQIIDDGMALARWFKPTAFGVEANAFQEVLSDIYAERSKACGMLLPLHSIHNHLNKEVRIRSTLTPYLARGEFRFLRGSHGSRMLVDQLRCFPQGAHDDGPDSLEMAVKLAQHVFYYGATEAAA